MAKYTTTMTVWHGGKAHLAGEAISLTAGEAKPLLAAGAIEQGGQSADAEAAAAAEAQAAAAAAQAQLPVDPA